MLFTDKIIYSSYTKGIKPGHIPTAKNIPYGTVVDKTARTLKSPEELKEMFVSSGIDLEQPLVASCGSGKHYLTHLRSFVCICYARSTEREPCLWGAE